MSNDINAALGERYESGFAPVLPKSVYPGRITVLSTGTSDVKEDSSGGTPYAELNLTITDGPFAGMEVTRKTYMTPGKGGGYLGLFAGWCKALTKQPANEAAFAAIGLKIPPMGNTDPKEYREKVREAVKEAFYTMAPEERLKFVASYVRLNDWNGKVGIVGLSVESRDVEQNDGSMKTYSNNSFESIFPLDDPKKGLAHYKTAIAPMQKEAFEAMQAEGLL